MSQRKEKYARRLLKRVDDLEDRVRDCEHSVITSKQFDSGMRAFLEHGDRDMNRQLAEERRKTRQAQHDARTWKVNAMITLVLLGLVAGVALTVAANAEEPEDSGQIPDDNISAPAAVEASENELIEAALLSKAQKIENVEVTYYCAEPYEHICGTGDGVTASGRRLAPYVSVAVDPKVIPLGSDVLVDYGDGDIQYYRADDVGACVNGKHIDVAVSGHQEALELGRRTATVYWVGADE